MSAKHLLKPQRQKGLKNEESRAECTVFPAMVCGWCPRSLLRGERTWAIAIQRVLSEQKFRTEFPSFLGKNGLIQKNEDFLYENLLPDVPSSSLSNSSSQTVRVDFPSNQELSGTPKPLLFSQK